MNRRKVVVGLFIIVGLFLAKNYLLEQSVIINNKMFEVIKKINNSNEIYVGNTEEESPDGTVNKPYPTLEKAIEVADDNSTIYLLSNIDASNTFQVTKNITISSYNNENYTISWSKSQEWGFIVTSSGNVSLKNITLDGENTSLSIFQVDNGNLSIEQGTVLKNSKTTWIGGAIHASNSTITMTGGEITGCEGSPGGAIALEANSNLIMSGGEIKNNKGNYAGAVFVNSSKVELSGSAVISNNSVTSHGGAFVLENSASLKISDKASISDNVSSNTAGAIYVNNSTVDMNNGTITKNKAGTDGGALFLDNSTFNGLGGVITQNQTTTGTKNSDCYRGGAIYSDNGSKIKLNNIKFEENKAVRGGAIYISENSTLTMESGSISNNIATANAGALFISYGINKPAKATILSGDINNNKCTGEDIDTSLISDTEFSAGAIYVSEKSTLELTNVVISNNKLSQEMFLKDRASDKGFFAGGIGVCPESEVYINSADSSAIYGNTSNGGADILLVTETSVLSGKSPSIYVSYIALGGGLYNWSNLNGEYVAGGQLDTKEKFVSLISNLTQEDIKNASEKAKVVISNNTVNAIYGGAGIMSNGILKIGNEKEEGGLEVTKTVIGANDDSEEFEFIVKLDNEKINGTYGEMEFKNGEATFKLKNKEQKYASNLPIGTKYTVSEKENKNYTTSYTNKEGTIVKGALSRVDVTNTNKKNQVVMVDDTAIKFPHLICLAGIILIITGWFFILCVNDEKNA